MENLIGRPPDGTCLSLVCPKCKKREMRKSGFRILFNRKGKRRVQAYACRICRFQTTKPLDSEEDNAATKTDR